MEAWLGFEGGATNTLHRNTIGSIPPAQTGEVQPMLEYLDQMHHPFSLHDSPLLTNSSSLSTTEDADLRKVFDGSLMRARPEHAATVVMNHDAQPGQTVETPVEGFFKPLFPSVLRRPVRHE